MPVPYQYPTNPWSVAKMRKRSDYPDKGNGDDATVQQVADVRRGQPDIGGWAAEAEKLAGSGIGARGGATATRAVKGAGGLSPETIQDQKAQINAYGSQWVSANIDWKKWHKKTKDLGWDLVFALDPTGRMEQTKEGTKYFTDVAASKFLGSQLVIKGLDQARKEKEDKFVDDQLEEARKRFEEGGFGEGSQIYGALLKLNGLHPVPKTPS